MQMLPNGNYESVMLPIQHMCRQDDFTCTQYSYSMDQLRLEIESGDPWEEGYHRETFVKICPFCGYGASEKKKSSNQE